MINIYYTKIDANLDFHILHKALMSMPQNIIDEVLQYKFLEQQQHTFFGKKLLQYIIQQHKKSYTLEQLQFIKNQKPFLANDFYFNISHSGNYVLIAYSSNQDIGIDIEKHRTIDINIFKKYFNNEEWQNIQDAKNKEEQFFDYWTIKEAAIKCDGRGVEILSKTNIFDASSLICDEFILQYKKIEIETNYSAAICFQDKIIDIKVEKIDPIFLLNC